MKLSNLVIKTLALTCGEASPILSIALEHDGSVASGTITVVGRKTCLRNVIGPSGLQKLSQNVEDATHGEQIRLYLSRPGSYRRVRLVVEVDNSCRNDVMLTIDNMESLKQMLGEPPGSMLCTVRASLTPVSGTSFSSCWPAEAINNQIYSCTGCARGGPEASR